MASQVRISSQGIVSMPDSVVTTAKLADGAVTPIKTGGGYSAQTTTYSATANDRVIDCTSGTFQVTIPAASSNTGRLLTVRNSGSGAITLGRTGADTIGGATSQVLNGKGSIEIVSNGSLWLVVRGTYTDETVGRRIFTWDDVNSRFQLTYGDTGVRSLTLTPNAPASTLDVELRRMNNICHIDVQWINGVITTPQVEFSLSDTALPAGFGNTRIARGVAWTNYLTSAGGAIHIASGNILKANVVANGMAAAGGSTMQRSWTYTTDDAWPSSLPGSASGTIPYG